MRQLTLVATVLGSSLAFLDATVVNVALPTIERDFDIGLAGEQWIVLSYSLALAALYLPAGSLGDRLGRRRAFVAGIVGFALASVVAGAAPNLGVLVTGRVLQGVAGAVLTPASLALLRAIYADEAGRAIGLWSGWSGIATIAGPPAGGALVEWASWRLVFFINLPLAALAIGLVLAGPGDERQERTGPPDVAGPVVAALALGLLTFGLVEAGKDGFGEPLAWLPAAVGVAGIVAFVAVEARVRNPMLPLGLFRVRDFAVANAATFLVYAALTGVIFFLTLELQSAGFSPFAAGILLAPTSLILLVLAPRFGAVADRTGPRLVLSIGPCLVAVAAVLFFLLEPGGSWVRAVPGVVVFGVGVSMIVAPITATALDSVPAAHSGLAAGVNTTISRVGGLLAVALVGLTIAAVFRAQTDAPDAVPLGRNQHGEVGQASARAFRAGMAVAAAFALAGGALALLLSPRPRDRGRTRSRPDP